MAHEELFTGHTGFERARNFHRAMGITVRDSPREPSVEERILRAKLLMEETLETIRKGLGVDVFVLGGITAPQYHGVEEEVLTFQISRPYDPVETLDGLADVKVIANGTAVQFGLPMLAADLAVYDSNMSKLDENGNPMVNGVTPGYRGGDDWLVDADANEEYYDSSKPVGKVLKGERYKPAMIGALIYTEESCPGHVAHKEDSKRCRNCGTHINELRPD